ncbi:MAG: hypothetical protein QM811_10215 [Pirellulales bacterium]
MVEKLKDRNPIPGDYGNPTPCSYAAAVLAVQADEEGLKLLRAAAATENAGDRPADDQKPPRDRGAAVLRRTTIARSQSGELSAGDSPLFVVRCE